MIATYYYLPHKIRVLVSKKLLSHIPKLKSNALQDLICNILGTALISQKTKKALD